MSSSHLHLFRSPTYAEIKARHDEIVVDDLSNRHSAINGWMEFHGYSDATRVQTEFGIDYSKFLKKYLAQFSRKTQANRKTILNRYKSIYFELLDTSGLPQGFHECLNVLIVPFANDLLKLAKAADVRLDSLKAWRTGIFPTFSSEQALRRLESKFGVPKGTLINRLPHLRLGKREHQTGKTAFGRKIKELQAMPFWLEFARWPKKAQDQWNALFKHKTAILLAKGERRNMRWNLDKRGRCMSAVTRLGWTENFFGFLVLSDDTENLKLRGKGLSIEDIDLGLLSDTELTNDFLEFVTARTGVYTEFCCVFLEFIHSLCRSNFGWFTQQPAMASHRLIRPKLPNQAIIHGKSIELTTQADQWAEWLAQSSAWIRSNRKSLRDKIEKGRSHEAIDPYLAEKHPMEVLFSLADTMEKNLAVLVGNLKSLALAYRAMFFVRFLTANPLRVKMFSIMTYRADNTGNLRQKSDGSWWLWFAKGDFKNFAGAAKDDYLVPLAASLWPYIESFNRGHTRPYERSSFSSTGSTLRYKDH